MSRELFLMIICKCFKSIKPLTELIQMELDGVNTRNVDSATRGSS